MVIQPTLPLPSQATICSTALSGQVGSRDPQGTRIIRYPSGLAMRVTSTYLWVSWFCRLQGSPMLMLIANDSSLPHNGLVGIK